MDALDLMRREKWRQTEKNLKAVGCEKCDICNFWMDKEYIKQINNKNVCDKCLIIEGGIPWIF